MHAGTAAAPSPTEATTSMSSRSENSSSSASRKTALSSTRRIRTGRDTGLRLLGGEKQRVVRLTAVLDVDVELRMLRCDALGERVERRRVPAGEEREQIAPFREQAVRDRGGHILEVGAAGNGRPVHEPEPIALANRDACELDVARGDRHLAGRDRRDRV